MRRGKPYHVREFEYTDFYDLHNLAKTIHADDASTDVNNMPVHWMQLKCIKVKQGVPNEIEVKEDYSEPYRRVILGQRDKLGNERSVIAVLTCHC